MASPDSFPQRIYPEQADPEDDSIYFSNGQVPPRFAAVQVLRREPITLAASGPLDKELLGIYLQPEQDDPLPDAIRRRKQELEGAQPSEALGLDEIIVDGDYPGGIEVAAKNIARLVLGSE